LFNKIIIIPTQFRTEYFSSHSLLLLQFIFVILKGQYILIPSGQLSWHSNRDQFSKPNDVLDLLLFETEVSIENSIMELILKCLR